MDTANTTTHPEQQTMETTNYTSAPALKEAVTAARNKAEREARKDCGRGILMSRGAWVIVTDAKNGDPSILSEGQLEFRGTQKQLNSLLAEYAGRDDVGGIYIEGGFNFALTIPDYRDGAYDPLVSEWIVPVWQR